MNRLVKQISSNLATMLNVAIAGSGITGLAAAISLRRNGHKVTIYERSALKNEVGAAIHVPPNVGRFLAAWGVDPVQARFVSARNMYFISPFSMEEMMKHDHSRDKEMYGASVDLAHRVDLHESLKSLATNADGPGVPAKIETGAQVVAYVSQICPGASVGLLKRRRTLKDHP